MPLKLSTFGKMSYSGPHRDSCHIWQRIVGVATVIPSTSLVSGNYSRLLGRIYWVTMVVRIYSVIRVERLVMGHYMLWWNYKKNMFNTLMLKLHWASSCRWHFTCIFVIKNFVFWFRFHWSFVPKCLIDDKSSLVQVMAWHHTGKNPLSETILTKMSNTYAITWPQQVNPLCAKFFNRNINMYLHFLSFLHTDMTCCWNPSSCKTRAYRLDCIVNIMIADDLATQGARASVAMILT